MSRNEYIQCLAALLSGDHERVRAANERLYEAAVEESEEDAQLPVLALAEADQLLATAT